MSGISMLSQPPEKLSELVKPPEAAKAAAYAYRVTIQTPVPQTFLVGFDRPLGRDPNNPQAIVDQLRSAVRAPRSIVYSESPVIDRTSIRQVFEQETGPPIIQNSSINRLREALAGNVDVLIRPAAISEAVPVRKQ